MRKSRLSALFLLFWMPFGIASSDPAKEQKTIYDYSLVGLDGKEISLSTYKGKVLLLVNLASKSIYKNQIQSLEDLQKTYVDKGLVLLGIPSADFGAGEVDDNAALRHLYLDTGHITFPVFSKTSLRGKNCIPLVHFLTDSKTGVGGGEIHWNFTKFVVDRQGKAILRFEADSDPADPEFRLKIEQVLDGTFKKAPADKGPAAQTSGDDDDGDGA